MLNSGFTAAKVYWPQSNCRTLLGREGESLFNEWITMSLYWSCVRFDCVAVLHCFCQDEKNKLTGHPDVYLVISNPPVWPGRGGRARCCCQHSHLLLPMAAGELRASSATSNRSLTAHAARSPSFSSNVSFTESMQRRHKENCKFISLFLYFFISLFLLHTCSSNLVANGIWITQHIHCTHTMKFLLTHGTLCKGCESFHEQFTAFNLLRLI